VRLSIWGIQGGVKLLGTGTHGVYLDDTLFLACTGVLTLTDFVGVEKS